VYLSSRRGCAEQAVSTHSSTENFACKRKDLALLYTIRHSERVILSRGASCLADAVLPHLGLQRGRLGQPLDWEERCDRANVRDYRLWDTGIIE